MNLPLVIYSNWRLYLTVRSYLMSGSCAVSQGENACTLHVDANSMMHNRHRTDGRSPDRETIANSQPHLSGRGCNHRGNGGRVYNTGVAAMFAKAGFNVVSLRETGRNALELRTRPVKHIAMTLAA